MKNSHIFAGSSNPQLAAKVASELEWDMGKATLRKFSDGEIGAEVLTHVRGGSGFVIQSTCWPSNDNLMEMLVLADALKRSDIAELTAVIPYFGYARQDRRPGYSRTPITSKLVADMIVTAGFDKVITLDIHSEQQQGFFPNYAPMINTSASVEIVRDIWYKFKEQIENGDLMVVSPDVGGTTRARQIAKRVGDAELAIIDKRRPTANESQVMNLIGSVEGKHCIIVDDMCDTAGTLCKAAGALKLHGALSVTSYATHPVLSGAAYRNILDSEIDEVVVTDTIPLATDRNKEAIRCVQSGRIRVISVAQLLAHTIRRMYKNQSVSEMYTNYT